MALIRFGPLQQAYPFVNLASGPPHQCAVRMSRCIRAAYPDFYEDLLKLGDTLASWQAPPERPRPERPERRHDSQSRHDDGSSDWDRRRQERAAATAPARVERRVLRTREAPGELFRFAQDMAFVLRAVSASEKWTVPLASNAWNPAQIRALERELNHSTQNGIIFFKNCFRPAGPNAGQLPAELRHHLDGQGDHIDLHVADRAGRSAPAGSGALARRMHARVSNHMEIWDGRSDEVWFWPLPL